jgi:hypothetical protein
MSRTTRLFARVLAPAWGRQHRDRYREEIEADLDGADELGISRSSLAFGQVRAAASVTAQGEVVLHPIGPLAIALRHAGAKRGVVLILFFVLATTLLAGIGLLLR